MIRMTNVFSYNDLFRFTRYECHYLTIKQIVSSGKHNNTKKMRNTLIINNRFPIFDKFF